MHTGQLWTLQNDTLADISGHLALDVCIYLSASVDWTSSKWPMVPTNPTDHRNVARSVDRCLTTSITPDVIATKLKQKLH